MDIVFFATVSVTSVLPDNGVFPACTCFFCNGSRCFFLQRWCFLQHFPGVFCNSSGRLLRRSPGVFLHQLKLVPYPFSFENRVSQM